MLEENYSKVLFFKRILTQPAYM